MDAHPDQLEPVAAPQRNGDLARRIAALCADVLRVPDFAPAGDFFAEGGDSLTAAQLVSLVAKELPGAEVSDLITAVFSERSPERIATALGSGASPVAPAPACPGGSGASCDGGPVPLSPLQLPIWKSEVFQPGTGKWNIVTAVHLAGDVDARRLIGAVERCIARHEALRTRIGRDGKVVVQRFDLWPDPVAEDLRLADLPAASRPGALREALAKEVRRPFDLDGGPLFRARLLRLGVRESVLALAAHHLVMDGWSVSLLLRDIAAAYGESGPEADLAGRYAATLRHQHEKQAADLPAALAYWVSRFPHAWPTGGSIYDADGPEPAAPLRLHSTAGAGGKLASACSAHGVTPFVAALAAFGAALATHSDMPEPALGAAVSRRSAESAGLVGVFLNFVPASVRIAAGRPFRETALATNRLWLESMPFQDAPFAAIQRELAASARGRGSLHLPFAINFHNYPAAGFDIAGATARIEHLATGHAQGDLALNVRPARDGTLELELLLCDPRVSAEKGGAILRDTAALLEEFAR
jgi:hypothetical protein